MAFTFDPTTSRGQVRLLIGDTDSANEIFPDASIDAFLAIHSDSVMLAAAEALDTMASSQAYIQKKTKIGDISTDGPAVAKALMERAAALRAQVDSEVDFDFAQLGVNDFSRREIIRRDALMNYG